MSKHEVLMKSKTQADVGTEVAQVAIPDAELPVQMQPVDLQYMIDTFKNVEKMVQDVMVEGRDYGKVEGITKRFLFKSGAEKLRKYFRLTAIVEDVHLTIYPEHPGHREVTVRMAIMYGDQVVAHGHGTCSTFETKYRYRSENTGHEVPGKYWQSRDVTLLGGPTYTARKTKKKWMIYQRVENPNIEDCWHTVLLIAKKRAEVNGTLSATAMSDRFSQDEDLVREATGGSGGSDKPDATTSKEKKAPVQEKAAGGNGSGTSNGDSPHVKALKQFAKEQAWVSDELFSITIQACGFESIDAVKTDNDARKVLKALIEWKNQEEQPSK